MTPSVLSTIHSGTPPMATNSTPQISQPHARPSPPGGAMPYSRKFQPSDRKSAGQAKKTAAWYGPPIGDPRQIISPPNRNRPGMASIISSGTPSGQCVWISYGPPSAQKPPMSSTARMPSQMSAIHATRPATPIR